MTSRLKRMRRGREAVKRRMRRTMKRRRPQRRLRPRRLLRGRQHLLALRDPRVNQMKTRRKKKHQVMEVVQIMSQMSR